MQWGIGPTYCVALERILVNFSLKIDCHVDENLNRRESYMLAWLFSYPLWFPVPSLISRVCEKVRENMSLPEQGKPEFARRVYSDIYIIPD